MAGRDRRGLWVGLVAAAAALLGCLGLVPLLLVDAGPDLVAPAAQAEEAAPLPKAPDAPDWTAEETARERDLDRVKTPEDRAFAEGFDAMIAQLGDCGVPMVHLCHEGGCTVLFDGPDTPGQQFLATLRGWRLVSQIAVMETLDLPNAALPCGQALEQLVDLGNAQEGDYGMTLASITGKMRCATMSRKPSVPTHPHRIQEQMMRQARRCEALIPSSGAVPVGSFFDDMDQVAVVVATRALPAGTVVAEADVVVRPLVTRLVPENSYLKTHWVVGRTVAEPIPAGDLVNATALVPVVQPAEP